MKKSLLTLAAAGGLAVAGLTGAVATAQNQDAASLRASGLVGEQADGFMACRASCDAAVQAAIREFNEQRARGYEAAAREVNSRFATAAAAGQASFRARLSCTGVPARNCIKPGEWYRPQGGGWTRK